MFAYLLRRLALGATVALSVSLLSFALLHLSGDAATAIAGVGAAQADIAAARKAHGLDQPILVQYVRWLGSALQGDLGESTYFNSPVTQVVAERIGITLKLGALAVLFATLTGVPLGVLSGAYPNSRIDRVCQAVALVGQAMPSFWFALLLMLVFGVHLRLLPISGSSTLAHFVLPTIALGYFAMPAIMRLTRAGMIEVLGSAYIRTAYAKGLSRPTVLFKHALRNAIVPVIAISAVQFGFMLGGSIIIETIFSMQGLGHLAWISISRFDAPVVQGVILILSMLYILLVFVADLVNGWLDPRIRVA